MRKLTEIEAITNALLHLPVPGKELRMAAMQVPLALLDAGFIIVPLLPDDDQKLASKRYARSTKIRTGPGFYRAMIAAKLPPAEQAA